MTDRKPRVRLLEAEIRTSERSGRTWYSAWLGRARLIGFEADEPNDRGHRVIRFFAEEPEPRPSTGPAPRPQGAGGRDGDRYRAPRRESERARQERVGAEIAAEHGAAGERPFDDAIPF